MRPQGPSFRMKIQRKRRRSPCRSSRSTGHISFRWRRLLLAEMEVQDKDDEDGENDEDDEDHEDDEDEGN